MRPIFVTHANAFGPAQPIDTTRLVAWAKFYPRAQMSLLPRFEREANVLAASVSAKHGVPVVDLVEPKPQNRA